MAHRAIIVLYGLTIGWAVLLYSFSSVGTVNPFTNILFWLVGLGPLFLLGLIHFVIAGRFH